MREVLDDTKKIFQFWEKLPKSNVQILEKLQKCHDIIG